MSTTGETDKLDAGPLGQLALSRSAVDRATQRRGDTAWVEAAWADQRSRVVVVSGSRSLVRSDGGHLELAFMPSAAAPEGTRFLLGVDSDEIAYFGVSVPGSFAFPSDTPAGGTGARGDGGHQGGWGAGAPHAVDQPPMREVRPPGRQQAVEGEARDRYGEIATIMSLRQAGAMLSDRDAGLFTHAVALANWHLTHTHCPQCGTPTVPAPAGHLTTCPADGTDHFPRLDPAVIMLVIDPDDRCLLARNAMWPQGRMSVLAGFVEPGESAEHAVAREVKEETAIVVGQVSYLGSQPWPMPRSLMLGFR